jgi:ribosome-associated toxin RatA of RatAB toxin-antitoxin module
MPNISQRETVPYSVSDMFTLIDNVKEYQSFLPWCDKSDELYRDIDEVKATLTIGAAGIQKSFSTHNLLQTNKMIEIRLLDGPFSHLEGFWRFDEQDGGGCKVSFDLEYEFSNSLIGMMAGPLFHQATSSMLKAFLEQAEKLYA